MSGRVVMFTQTEKGAARAMYKVCVCVYVCVCVCGVCTCMFTEVAAAWAVSSADAGIPRLDCVISAFT